MMNFFLQRFEDVRGSALEGSSRASVTRRCVRFIDVFTVFPRTLRIKKPP